MTFAQINCAQILSQLAAALFEFERLNQNIHDIEKFIIFDREEFLNRECDRWEGLEIKKKRPRRCKKQRKR